MFTFKPYDDVGCPKDDVYDDLKKDFHFEVYCDGLEKMKHKIFVRLNGNFIQFFLDSGLSEKERMIESVSLTYRKDTGYDLLYFAEDIQPDTILKGNNIDDTKEVKNSAKKFLDAAKQIFFCFPFLQEKKCENPDQDFMRVCLLEFLLAIDTHDDIFALNPDFDETRKKLRESKVYCLLCAKLRYCMYRYRDREALDEEEYTFVVSKFADLLMDKNYNKMVPPDYYDKPRFLYNPEKELLKIMRRQDAKNLIREATQEKIRAFFLTKHATIECDFGKWTKRFKIVRFLLMIIMVVWMVLAMIWFDLPSKSDAPSLLTCLANGFYDSEIFLWLLAAWLALSIIIFVFPVTCGLKPNRRVGGKVFHSRIIVALLMGWFAIAVSEDLIKSQLELSRPLVWWALVAVLIIVGVMLWGEVRQHSPYYCRLKLRKITSWPKVTVVLIYAMFWNLLIGIVMQSIMYSPLLETSGAMPDAILGQMPNEVGKYRNAVESCIGMLDDYERTMNGVLHDRGNIRTVPTTYEEKEKTDTAWLITKTLNYRIKQSLKPEELATYIETHNTNMRKMNEWANRIVEMNAMGFSYDSIRHCTYIKKDSLYYSIAPNNTNLLIRSCNKSEVRDSCEFKSDPIFSDFIDWLEKDTLASNIKDENEVKNKIDYNLSKARDLKSQMRYQLALIDAFLQKECNQQRLREDAIFVNDTSTKDKIWTFETKNYYLAYLGYDASVNHKFCRKFTIRKKDDGTVVGPTLFPRMLVFHALIVLILAFVGQLIISDKSVTEPL